MKVSLIVAMARNRVIGRDGDLPWRLPADLKYFKARTMGHHIIMGRKTWESIGRPLPGRTMVVVTRQPDYRAEGCAVVGSLEAGLDVARAAGDDEVMVVGGASLYAEALPRAHRLYLTEVEAEVEGDVTFPVPDGGWGAEWTEVSREAHPADDRHPFPYAFVVLERL